MALDEYYGQNFNDAHELFRQSARLEPNQPDMPGVYTNPSLIFIERCETMLQNASGSRLGRCFCDEPEIGSVVSRPVYP
jgi:hypothetical protein